MIFSKSQDTPGNGNGLTPTARLARWSAAHRWWVLGASVLVLVLAVFASTTFTTQLLDEGNAGEGEAAVGADLVNDRFEFNSAPSEQLVFLSETLTVDDPVYRSTVENVVSNLRTLPEVESVTSYYDNGDPAMVSAGRNVVLAQVVIAGHEDDAHKKVDAITSTVRAAAAANSGFEITVAGITSLEKQTQDISKDDMARVLMITIVLGLVILLIAFRALVAAVIPLVLAVGAIIAAVGIATLVSQAYPLSEVYIDMVFLMGLAVGIDYSLFIISRYRFERKAGRAKLDAITVASNTTGRAVFYAGITVMLSLAGLMLTQNPIFISLALGAIIVVLFTVIGSLTLLPAVLSVLGDNINRLRVPIIGRESKGGAGFWGAISDRVLARPAVFAAVTAGALVALSIPMLSLNLGFNAGADAYDDAVEGKRALEILEENFTAGLASPAYVVVDHSNVNSPEVQASVANLLDQVNRDVAYFAPFVTNVNPQGDLLYIEVPIAGAIDDDVSKDAITHLRDDIIPAAFEGSSAQVYVSGQTAGSMDFTEQMISATPIVFAFVLGLAFLILLAMFRSVVIPAKAIILNLLSVSAAYGVVVLVFQDGVGQSITGFQSTGVIGAWLPLFLFAILFGLSMDYHMLLLNRIKEAYDRGASNEESVSSGIRATAGTITSAAAIMVGVFGAFALGSEVGMQQFGVGLGVAVLLDATIIRVILLPAIMKLLGDSNWYLPSWLEWLPKVTPEAEPAAAPAPVSPSYIDSTDVQVNPAQGDG